jgi:hypothetical protein
MITKKKKPSFSVSENTLANHLARNNHLPNISGAYVKALSCVTQRKLHKKHQL